MRRTLWAIAMAGSLGVPGAARAQPAGYHEHDGFYLNMDLGLGFLRSKTTSQGLDRELSGGAGAFSIALGGAVTPSFVLAGRLFGASVSSPTVKEGGQSLGSSGSDIGLGGIGLDLTYYFMPYDVFVTVTPAIGTLSEKVGGLTETTKNGFALRLAVGKEWWVSDNWGLGLDAQFLHGTNETKGGSPLTWSTDWFGVAFSATYN